MVSFNGSLNSRRDLISYYKESTKTLNQYNSEIRALEKANQEFMKQIKPCSWLFCCGKRAREYRILEDKIYKNKIEMMRIWWRSLSEEERRSLILDDIRRAGFRL